MPLQLQIASHSEIGLVRKNNQDSGYASPQLLVVADGMGGAAAGDLASAVAIDTIRRIDISTAVDADMLELLAGALHRANDRIADLVDANYSLEGMGTTVTGALFDGSQLALAHIGDSRAYLLHEKRLERLTHDHSWVQSLVDDGKISDREAAVHPHRSLLLKVLNGQPANDPDLTLVKVQPGDRLLLCSDGLCGLVDDPVIEQALLLPDLETALRRLVDEALAEGGVDNITVILADVVDPGATGVVADGETATAEVLGAAAELRIPAVETRVRPPGDGVDDADDETTEDTDEFAAARTGATALSGAAAVAPEALVVAPAPPPLASAGPDGAATTLEDEERYRPQPPHKRRSLRPLVAAVVLALVVGAGLASAYAWTRTQFYVGASDDSVAIFQGLSDGIPGLSLSRVYEVQPLAVSALPPYYQERVRSNIDVLSLSAARETVGELSEAATRCAIVSRARPTPTPRPQPAPSRTASPQTNPASTAQASPGPRTSPTSPASLAASTPPSTTPAPAPESDC
ncbi:MAG TPA: protein phosphatase 2C domain-containing protein [Propionibacteriaceae bacterium]|jgi:protein phosphatase